jgi:hypothetical protein
MQVVNANAYRLLGQVAWRGGKWYLRQRLPSARRLVLGGMLAGAALGTGVVLVRRAGA